MDKVEIALIQLRTSIQLYKKGNYISSITLAGAAEEILGKFAIKAGKSSELEETKFFWDSMADFLNKDRPSKDKIFKTHNRVRNELKHNDSGLNYSMLDDFQFEAEEYIIRGIKNYIKAFDRLPNDRIIKNFYDWMTM